MENLLFKAMKDFETKCNCFGTVTWDMTDLNGALETEDAPATKENLETLYDAIDMDDLREAMIQAGWEYIYGIIRDLVQYGDLKTN